MCDFVKDGATPDLVVYTDLKNAVKETIYSSRNFTQTLYSYALFSETELTNEIGVYMRTLTTAANGKILTNVDYVSFNDIPGGFALLSINSMNMVTFVSSITGGSGNFLNASGFTYFDKSNGEILVYFTKC